MEQEKHTILQEMSFQRAAGWIAIIGTTTFVVGFFAFLLLSLWRAEEWMINIIPRVNFPVITGGRCAESDRQIDPTL